MDSARFGVAVNTFNQNRRGSQLGAEAADGEGEHKREDEYVADVILAPLLFNPGVRLRRRRCSGRGCGCSCFPSMVAAPSPVVNPPPCRCGKSHTIAECPLRRGEQFARRGFHGQDRGLRRDLSGRFSLFEALADEPLEEGVGGDGLVDELSDGRRCRERPG
jgi:hypothetical protein